MHGSFLSAAVFAESFGMDLGRSSESNKLVKIVKLV